MERVPDGEQVFALLPGAKYGQWDPNKIEVGAKIVEGEYEGRVVYFSYPDPGKQSWSPGALKRLEKALVLDGAEPSTEHQDPVEYLNQSSVVGKRFVAPVSNREYTKSDGEKGTKTDIKLFKVKAVANA